MVITNSLLCPCAGVLLALVSGILFTTNNFLVSLYRVRPGHLVLVRSMAQVMVFALIVVFLQFRPAGLFPQKGRMVEA